MKVLLFISTLILIVSCGKYERPIISFKSPEKRLTEGTWGCTKAVDSAGNEFEVEDRITFSICLLYTSPSPRDVEESRMPSSA